MKLGKIIREYRQHHRISMGDFAKASGLSKPYVSMLESDKNSNGGKPIKPSVETLLKVSCVLGVTLEELLRKLGDEEIDLRQPKFSAEETDLIDGWRKLSSEGKQLIVSMIQQLNFGRASSPQPDKITAPVSAKVINGNLHNSGGTNIVNVDNGNFNSPVPSQ